MSKTKVRAIEQELQSRYLERDEEIHGLLLATLSGHHIELLGPPGTAKSQLIRDLASYVDPSECFIRLMTKHTTPDEVLGPWDISAIKAGVMKRITTGKLPEARYAFLDEIYKSNSAILNSLLTLLQERTFDNDGATMHCPLITCIGASNELPDEDEGLEALRDRFLLRFHVKYIEDRSTFLQLLRLQHGAKIAEPLTRAELEAARLEIQALELDEEAVESVALVHETLQEQNIYASDRRYKNMISVMAAESWLLDANAIVSDSLTVGQHILWEKPDQIRTVKQVVLSSVHPSLSRANEILTAAEEAIAELRADYVEPNEMLTVVQQLGLMVQDLESLTSGPAVLEVTEKVRKHRTDLTSRMIDAAPRVGV